MGLSPMLRGDVGREWPNVPEADGKEVGHGLLGSGGYDRGCGFCPHAGVSGGHCRESGDSIRHGSKRALRQPVCTDQ